MKKQLLLTAVLLFCCGMSFIGYNTYKLSTAPGTGVNPPTGYIYQWPTLDESDNLVINYRLSDGTDKTFTAGTGTGGGVPEPTAITASTYSITSADNGKLLTNYGAAVDTVWTLDSRANLGNSFSVGILNEVDFGGIDSYTKLMLHFNNNATDSSTSNHTPTATDITYTNSAGGFKFGYAGIFNGTTGKISYPDSNDFYLSNGDFSISCWIKLDAVNLYQRIFGIHVDDTHYFAWTINSDKLHFYCQNGNDPLVNIESALSTETATWYHFAVVRNGNNFYMFRDGVPLSLTKTVDISGVTLPNFAAVLQVGALAYTGAEFPLDGNIDEFRWDKGIARWTADFSASLQSAEYYQGSTITLTPAATDKLPNTAATGSSIKSSGKGDFIGIRTASSTTYFYAESAMPTLSAWVDQLD